MTVHGRFAAVAATRGDATAVIDHDRRVSWAELADAVEHARARLVADAGIARGDRVAIVLPNGVESIVAFFAIAAAGAVAAPLDPRLRPAELARYADALPLRAGIGSGIGNGGSSDADAPWQPIPTDWFAPDATAAAADPAGAPATAGVADDEVLDLATSGSTGDPRVVARTHRGLLAGVDSVGAALGITAADRVLAVVPFHHANGFSNGMFLPLLHGATVVPLERFAPERFVETVRGTEATVLVGSPFLFRILADHHPDPRAFDSVRIALSSGAPMTVDLAAACRDRLGLRVRQLYGSTETGTIAIEPDGNDDPGWIPVPGVEVRVIDADGCPVAAGAIGEIVVRGPAVMRGYLVDAGAARFVDGFLRTGDLGSIDADGRIRLGGRLKRVLNVAGVKIDPVEIERVLGQIAGVREVRVEPVPNGAGDERILARIVAAPGAAPSRAEIIARCRRELAEHKIPRRIEFVPSLASDPTGKVRAPDRDNRP